MNDPGHDDEIAQAANQTKEFEKQKKEKDDQDAEDERETAFNTSAKWWYASTAFPLVAGTFGPVANAFSICALVEHWRVSIPPGGTEEHGSDIPDPPWLIAVNAVSLVFALIANLALLLNMAKRLRFEIAQPVTILGFWIASILLIGLLSFASTKGFHEPGVQDQALNQAFYYGIFAAGLYQIISYLMCMTAYGAYYDYYSKDFQLNVAQRTLMLQTISFLVYLLLGSLVYSKIEGWMFLDSMFWADFTLLTIGLGGQYVPATHLGRGLLFPFAIGGIITIGLVVSSIRTLALERGAQKMSARMMEKTRRRAVKQVLAAQKKNHARGKPMFGLSKSVANKLAQGPVDDKTEELQRRKLEFQAMRRVQEMADREQKYLSLFFSMSAFAFLWLVGAALFWKCEKNQSWTYFDSLYFAYTSVLTIGYGDYIPMSNSGKPLFVFWSLLAIPTLTILISDMGDTVVKGIKDATIWLGEISVLPSTDAAARERLKRGMYRATLGKFNFGGPGKDEEKDSDVESLKAKDDEETRKDDADKDWSNMSSQNPGLVKLFESSDKRKIDKHAVATLDQLAEAWSVSEELDETEARENKDKRAEAQHHYRRLLISQISKVYADTKLSTPKQYNYLEWSFYLKLLGEDESDASRHRKPNRKPVQDPAHKRHASTASHTGHDATHNRQGSNDAQAGHDTQNPDQDATDAGHKPSVTESGHEEVGPPTNESESRQASASKWSWMGQRSPLMADKDEAEWILEHLFKRLEESFRALSKEREYYRKHADLPHIHDTHTDSTAASDESDISGTTEGSDLKKLQ